MILSLVAATVALATPGSAGASNAQVCGTLQATVPTTGPAASSSGMGTNYWNIVLTNPSAKPCAIAGWPGVTVSGPAGTTASQVTDVSSNALGPVPAGAVTLQPGQQAVVSVATTSDAPACVEGADLVLAFAGGATSTVELPTGDPGVCAGGAMSVSSVYPLSALASAVTAAASPAGSLAFATANTPPPTECAVGSLTAAAASQQATSGGSVVVVRLSNRSTQPCALPGGVVAVRANEPAASPVGKLFAGSQVSDAAASALRTYVSGSEKATAAAVPAEGAVDLTVLALNTNEGACAPATSLSVYPSALATGSALQVALSKSVTVCGSPLVLPVTVDSPSTNASVALGTSALATVAAESTAEVTSPQAITPANASGFTYGTDSNGPTATGSGPYNEPDMPAGQSAIYGLYVGQRGTYTNYVCGTSGLQWNATDYNDAQWNETHGESGAQGASAVYMTGGPGRDPSYTGTTGEASAWGKGQADNAISGANAAGTLSVPYIFMDIESVVSHGWNAVWNGCGSTEKASSIPAATDYATFTGFVNEVWNNSPYFIGVYDAGGSGPNSWSSVFGSITNGSVAEWTYVNETTSLSTFPNGWAVGSTVPSFFGGVTTSSTCARVWQWSGGNGDLNGKGDFDQFDISHAYSCAP